MVVLSFQRNHTSWQFLGFPRDLQPPGSRLSDMRRTELQSLLAVASVSAIRLLILFLRAPLAPISFLR